MRRQPTKILYIYPYYHPSGTGYGGGTKFSTITLVSGLSGKYTASIAAPAPGWCDEEFVAAGADLIHLGIPDHLAFEFARLSPTYLMRYVWRLFKATLILCRIIRKGEYEIVHSQTTSFLGGSLAAKLSGVPSVMHVREATFRVGKLGNYLYYSLIDKLADHVICCAQFLADGFTSHGVSPDKVHTVYNAVDLGRYTLQPGVQRNLKEAWGIPQNHRVVGFVGRLAPRKGAEYFIQAAQIAHEQFADASFVVVGGNDEPHEQSYVKSLHEMGNGLIIFAGARKDIEDVFNTLDVLVFTSPRDFGPRVPIEAMAMGVPVVTASFGGAREEVVDHVTGFQCEVGDSKGIAEAIFKLLRDDDLRVRMGRAGRDRVERMYSQSSYVDGVTKVYELILGGSADAQVAHIEPVSLNRRSRI